MFELETQIAEWRAELARTGIAREVVDELESHLREDCRRQISAGETAERAFESAVSRLGDPASIQTEFKKNHRTVIWPVRIGLALWLAASILPMVRFLDRLAAGETGRILFAHILTLTAGYAGVFLLTGLGICYVWMRRSRKLSVARRLSLNRTVRLVCQAAAGLVFAGLVLGMLWSERHEGVFWEWRPMEIGCLSVVVWLVAMTATQRLNLTGERATMLLCIGGGMLVSAAWFGAQVFHLHQLKRGNGLGDYLLLAIILSVLFGFLAMGLLPAQKNRLTETKYV